MLSLYLTIFAKIAFLIPSFKLSKNECFSPDNEIYHTPLHRLTLFINCYHLDNSLAAQILFFIPGTITAFGMSNSLCMDYH